MTVSWTSDGKWRGTGEPVVEQPVQYRVVRRWSGLDGWLISGKASFDTADKMFKTAIKGLVRDGWREKSGGGRVAVYEKGSETVEIELVEAKGEWV